MNYFNYPGIRNREKLTFKTTVTKEQMTKIVCDYFEIPLERIFKKSRKKELVLGRHVICFLLFKYSKLSKTDIAKFVNKDHTTVINGLRTLQDLMDTEKGVREDVENIRTKIFECEIEPAKAL